MVKFELRHLFFLTGYLAFSLAVLTCGIKEKPLFLGLTFLLIAGMAILLTITLRQPRCGSRIRRRRQAFDAFVVGPIVGLLVSAGIFCLNLFIFEALMFGLMSTISMIVLVYSTPPPLGQDNRSK